MSNPATHRAERLRPTCTRVYDTCPRPAPRSWVHVRGSTMSGNGSYLRPDSIYHGDARKLLDKVEPDSITLSFWSPPYFVGKSYEKHLKYDDWCDLLQTVIAKHHRILKPGA